MLRSLLRYLWIFTAMVARCGALRTTTGSCNCSVELVANALGTILPANASVENVTYVDAGGSYGEGKRNLMYPTAPTDLPELCAVTIYIQSSNSSWYRFGVFLPVHWSSRFLAIGNGGFGGGINWLDMGAFVKYGFAVVSTDTGHNSTVGDARWALNQSESKTDWGWRSLHGTVQLGKQIVEAYYGANITYSYYNGCSNGGRQGLKEIQISPDSFDGVVIGAPGWYSSHLNPWFTRVGINNLPWTADRHIGIGLFTAMGDLVIRQCDLLDGVEDGIVSLPGACEPDYTEMLCSVPGIDQSACLTEEQAAVPQRVYSDFQSVTGKTLYPGLSPGCEGQWQAVLSLSTTSPFGWGYIGYFLLDSPHWNWRYWKDSLVDLAQLTDPGGCTADDFNLTDFKNMGHKIIMYHGLADGLIPPRGSDLYYNSVMEEMGESLAEMQSWFRYFQIPGMQHCWSTQTAPASAPWNIGGEFQATHMGTDEWSVPGFRDKRHDVLMALIDWVENDNPVDSIIATTWNSVWNASSGVRSQRPLCPYPQMAMWDGEGDVDVAASWSCG